MQAAFLHAGDRESGVICPHCSMRVNPGDDVAKCLACATVHHRACWEQRGGCGSYTCAPARRPLPSENEQRIQISMADIDRANPIVAPVRSYAVPSPYMAPAVRAGGGTSRMAIASLILAVLGIPFFGLLTGAVAVVVASFAFGDIGRNGRKGTGLAIGGLVLGLGDVLGWLIVIVMFFGGDHSGPMPTGRRITEAELKTLPATISRGMRANVLVRAQHNFGSALGSGIIMKISAGQAQILTNRHVIDENFESAAGSTDVSHMKPVTVDILGQPPVEGRVVWIAPDTLDLALLSVPCASTSAAEAKWPRTKPMRVGDSVFAIGNPHGWEWSHTQGYISQFRVSTLGPRDVTIIQTSVPINPGNSGGGLYDSDGALIGINTWTADKRVSEGLSFSISLDGLKDLSLPLSLSTTRPVVETQP